MLGYMIALTLVTRPLGYFCASKPDLLLDMSLLWLKIYLTLKDDILKYRICNVALHCKCMETVL